MGYYSKVRICSKRENIEKLKADMIAKGYDYMFKPNELSYDEVLSDGTEAIGWDWVKWYDTFDEVSAIENEVYSWDDYEFARIGEDRTDIEYESNFNWDERDSHLDIITDIDVY